jgi:general secretion pathway protein G
MNDRAPNQKPVRWRIIADATFGVLTALGAVFFAIFALVVLALLHPACGCGGKIDVAKIFVSSEIDTVLQVYKAQNGDYPTTQQGLQALLAAPAGVAGWKGPYLIKLTTIPPDPWGHPYQYAYPSIHGQPAGQYDCWSLGPDGVNDTADNFGNWQK